jgi:hypothetical protein
MAQMRTSSRDEAQLMFMVFDLLHQDGVDLRGFDRFKMCSPECSKNMREYL